MSVHVCLHIYVYMHERSSIGGSQGCTSTAQLAKPAAHYTTLPLYISDHKG